MLCGTWTSENPAGWWLSEKLDGARATWDGETLWSRQGNRLNVPAWFTAEWPQMPLDGELWAGRSGYCDVQRALKCPGDDDVWRRVRFMAFDVVREGATVEDRLAELAWITELRTLGRLRHMRCEGRADLVNELITCLDVGAEGVVLRRAGSRYVRAAHNRDYSPDMLKVRVQNNMSLVLTRPIHRLAPARQIVLQRR